MRNIKIIHAADFHLDSPYQSLTVSKAAMRREEQREMLAELAKLSAEEHADLMLLSGDLLDSGNTLHETGDELMKGLAKVPCPVFISPGSSDWYSPQCPYARIALPENVVVFRDSEIRFLSIPSAEARIYGAAFTDRRSGALLKGFHAERKDGIYNLLCMHGEVGNPESSCNPITSEEIASSGMDYIALGHIHSASALRKSGNTWYSWPGCPEGHGFEESGEKTVNIVELSGEDCRLRTACISSRRYRSMTLDITGKDALLLIHTSLPDDTVRDIYRIILTGTVEQAPDLNRLYRNLDEMFFSLRLTDRTRLPEGIWEEAGDDTLRALFLKKMKTRFDEAQDDSQKMGIEKAVRWGLAALDNSGEVAVH